MIGISKLYCGAVEPSDVLRYNRKSGDLPSHLLQFSSDKKPVVVWNMTRRCNLKCIHCYSNSADIDYPDELTTDEGKKLIDDLAAFGSPVILFSGGEPLLRKDLLELAQYARDKGMRAVISTNGTLITKDIAAKLQKAGLSYVGVSLDGLEKTHDRFRGKKGAFAAAIEGIRNCRDAGIKVGIRFTVNKHNVADVPDMFELLRKKKIERMCFYHLVYTGRGSKLREEDLTHEETRKLIDLIAAQTKKMFDEGLSPEILTVDNHADGPYLYLKMKKENPGRAREILELLEMNEGNSSGLGIGCVSWDGEVYPDQFWRNQSLGNVRNRSFGEIWTDEKNEFLMKMKDKKRHVQGRCAGCLWLNVCGGNFRARAESAGELWGPDPACYLTDEEIHKRED
ncbi:Fe-S oxidoreductase [Smithella sp. SCADC]|jgi:12,18-didecarboxysiroheme deacetylase|nr:Fe-S oxidoreductase [Smithella sp. SCADC]HAR50168.1 12,18-didecarboxysiroheme deacetylase [Smithella sp.]